VGRLRKGVNPKGDGVTILFLESSKESGKRCFEK
jgi:hypothetical protein